ncbi:5284_t:CDS:2, partial [Rhizophagus irregularis]
KAGQDQVSLQKISDTVTSGNIFSEKPVSAKNGQGLIQEISRNFNESGTPSSIQDYNSTCALPLDPPRNFAYLGKNHTKKRKNESESEGSPGETAQKTSRKQATQIASQKRKKFESESESSSAPKRR